MNAHRVETIINKGGALYLDALPFMEGDAVEVIILKVDQKPEMKKKRTVGEYAGKIRMSDDFSEPLPDEFWLGEKNNESVAR